MAKFLVLSLFFALSLSIASAGEDEYTHSNEEVDLVSGLSWSFYESTCPKLESIVKKRIKYHLKKDITQAAGLLRLHFHDCFVQGCDASVLLDGSASGPSEQDAPPNLTLRQKAFEIINDIKEHVDKACDVVVSCADIAALAARESVSQTGGPKYRVPLGRRDSSEFATRNVTVANLPPPTSNASALIDALAAKGLDATDLVALSGGHTIGIGHCASFEERLYPTEDNTLARVFARNLKATCPTLTVTNTTVLDIRSPNLFDNMYYVNRRNREGLFTLALATAQQKCTWPFISVSLFPSRLQWGGLLSFPTSNLPSTSLPVPWGTLHITSYETRERETGAKMEAHRVKRGLRLGLVLEIDA